MFSKVLVCCPTAKVKNYCFESWLENVMNFSYPDFDIRMFDNTNDNGANAEYLNKVFYKNYGFEAGLDSKFFAQNTILLNGIKTNDIVEKMCYSHNDCRNYLLQNNYDYMLHLESDVFPESDVIESLLFESKNVIGANYYTNEGLGRFLMVQKRLEIVPGHILSINFMPQDDLNFLDGEIKEAASLGLGCVLIKRSVFDKIKFRFIKGVFCHPDSYFGEDCFMNKIKIYSHTQKICRHENKLWGIEQ